MIREREKTIYNRFLAAVLAFLLVLSADPLISRADERSDAISALQQREQQAEQAISELEKQTEMTRNVINSLEGQKEETLDHVNDLQNRTSSLQSTIRGYSSQLEELSAEISETEQDLAELSAAILELEKELKEAESQERDRYKALKKRIQGFYETGGINGMMELILESGDMKQLLSRTEYLKAVVQYDYKKIGEYQELQKRIEEKAEAVREKEAQMQSYQASLDEKHSALADLTDSVKGELSETRSDMNSEKAKLHNYEEQLIAMSAQMKALEAQTAAAQAQLAQAIAERLALEKEDTSGAYAASGTELEWLAATIQAEADGESYTGKLAVGSVIMNRVKSSAFPNSIIGVITQNMQFASYRSGKVELIISRGPNSTCLQAAREVLGGARIGDYLFFMTKYYADYYGISEYTMIGNHAFFYRWVTNKSAAPQPPVQTEETGQESQEATQEPEETAQETPETEAQEAQEETPEEEASEESNTETPEEEASEEEQEGE